MAKRQRPLIQGSERLGHQIIPQLKNGSDTIVNTRFCRRLTRLVPTDLWHDGPMQRRFPFRGFRIVLLLVVFATLTTAVLLRPAKWLSDFDQLFYLTIAYDIVHHGVFSNGVFDNVDSTRQAPPPGRFFGPIYPALVVVAMKLDPRFARAVDCSVEANHKARDGAQCEVYAGPIHIIHGAMLAVGVLAIAFAAQLIFASTITFWLASGLATLALLADADLFSFVMTESLTFSLYNLAALSLVVALKEPRLWKVLVVGCLFGLLALTRASYVVLALVVPVLFAIYYRWAGETWRLITQHLVAFAIGWMVVVSPWLARNAMSVGHWGLTEEYGSATLIERFAYNDMSVREFLLAFPYCLPEVGPPLTQLAVGSTAMERFVYHTPVSFFHAGRHHRDKLVEAHGRLDPLIGDIVRKEMSRHWWRHLAVSAPLAWCGMWVGGWLGLVLVPFFAAACIAIWRRSKPLFLIYAAPAIAMLGLHAAVANQYTRYNLILIGPFSIGAAWLIGRVIQRIRGARSQRATMHPISEG